MQVPLRLSAKDRALPLPALLAAMNGKDGERISLTTIRKAMGMLQAVLGWCVKNGHLEANPMTGMMPALRDSGRERRLPFDSQDLLTIFSSPLYQGCASTTQRWKPGSLLIKDSGYWLPLLALYTGCRLEELGQLLAKDVKTEAGITYIDINTLDDGKSLKTSGSRRKIPLHPKIITSGFLIHVDGQIRTKEGRLFPDLERDARGKTTAAWSKWWGRYCTKICLNDPRKVFHSFRHTFKDACRAAGIEEAIHDALTGHAASHVGRSYGQGFPLSVLAEAIAKINVAI